MKITVNHPDKEVQQKIMDWMRSDGELMGNEEYLVGEKLTDIFAPSEIIELEGYLSFWFDEAIEIRKDLIFIEVK